MKFGVVVFPGSNCDHDAFYAISDVLHQPVEFIWHQSEDLANSDAVILPGGFAHGDYLRTGAIARFSPVMKPVEKFAKSGGLVLGICNGFRFCSKRACSPAPDAQRRPALYLPPRHAWKIPLHRSPAPPSRPDPQNPHRAQRRKLHLRPQTLGAVKEKRSNCFSLHHARRQR